MAERNSPNPWVDPLYPPKDDLPERVVVGANGAYWRDYGTHYSMCPVSTDNDPIEIVAAYIPALAPEREALSSGEQEWPVVLAWWQELAVRLGVRAERAEAATTALTRELDLASPTISSPTRRHGPMTRRARRVTPRGARTSYSGQQWPKAIGDWTRPIGVSTR